MLIIGHGSIGRALEKRLLPFGANVSGIARTAREGVHSMSGESWLLEVSAQNCHAKWDDVFSNISTYLPSQVRAHVKFT